MYLRITRSICRQICAVCIVHACHAEMQQKKKCGVRECKSVLRCGLIWQRALKLCDISFFRQPLRRWSFDSFAQSDCVSQTDLFSRVFRFLFFLQRHYQCSPHFIGNVITKYENFRIKLQVKREIKKKRKTKRNQYINTAFTLESCKLLVLSSHRIPCIFRIIKMLYECIKKNFQQITHSDDLSLCYWWCALR